MNLIEINGVFNMETGAPSPILLSSEAELKLAFFLDEEPYCCALNFSGVIHHKFGSPGNESIHGHPYRKLGLESYGFYELKFSDYIEQISRINEVHNKFDPELWMDYKHFIITFHDTMFECIGKEYSFHNISLEKYNQIASCIKLV